MVKEDGADNSEARCNVKEGMKCVDLSQETY